jgi:hypothetical protein
VRLADGFCQACGREVPVIGVEYEHGPEHYDGVSEWACVVCHRREGRWTGRVLQEGDVEPPHGESRPQTGG